LYLGSDPCYTGSKGLAEPPPALRISQPRLRKRQR